jgi:hypothetical protein
LRHFIRIQGNSSRGISRTSSAQKDVIINTRACSRTVGNGCWPAPAASPRVATLRSWTCPKRVLRYCSWLSTGIDGGDHPAAVHGTGGKEVGGMVRACRRQMRRRVSLGRVQMLPGQGERRERQGARSSHDWQLLPTPLAGVGATIAGGRGAGRRSGHKGAFGSYAPLGSRRRDLFA